MLSTYQPKLGMGMGATYFPNSMSTLERKRRKWTTNPLMNLVQCWLRKSINTIWGGKPKNRYYFSTSSGHRSANEQLPASIRFVKVADITEDASLLFVEKFQ
jgi:hypothetical protein